MDDSEDLESILQELDNCRGELGSSMNASTGTGGAQHHTVDSTVGGLSNASSSDVRNEFQQQLMGDLLELLGEAGDDANQSDADGSYGLTIRKSCLRRCLGSTLLEKVSSFAGADEADALTEDSLENGILNLELEDVHLALSRLQEYVSKCEYLHSVRTLLPEPSTGIVETVLAPPSPLVVLGNSGVAADDRSLVVLGTPLVAVDITTGEYDVLPPAISDGVDEEGNVNASTIIDIASVSNDTIVVLVEVPQSGRVFPGELLRRTVRILCGTRLSAKAWRWTAIAPQFPGDQWTPVAVTCCRQTGSVFVAAEHSQQRMEAAVWVCPGCFTLSSSSSSLSSSSSSEKRWEKLEGISLRSPSAMTFHRWFGAMGKRHSAVVVVDGGVVQTILISLTTSVCSVGSSQPQISRNAPNGLSFVHCASDRSRFVYVTCTSPPSVFAIDFYAASAAHSTTAVLTYSHIAGCLSTELADSSGISSDDAENSTEANIYDGPGPFAVFNAPVGIAVHPVTDAVYVADRIGGVPGSTCLRIIQPPVVYAPESPVVSWSPVVSAVVQSQPPTDSGSSAGSESGAAGSYSGGYVANAERHTIALVDLRAETLVPVAGVAYTEGWVDGPWSQARFRNPMSVVVDSHGFLYVADAGNHRIRKLDPRSRTVSTAAGTGRPINRDGSALMEAGLYSPHSLWYDSADHALWIVCRCPQPPRPAVSDDLQIGDDADLTDPQEALAALALDRSSSVLFRRLDLKTSVVKTVNIKQWFAKKS